MAASTATIIPTTTSTALVALTEKRASERYATDSNATALGLTKTQLRESLAKLMETRTLQDAKLWSSRTSVTGPLAKAVEQYYVMFGHGLVVPGKDSVPAAQEAHDLQVGFLHNYMDQDVRFGESSGRSIVYEQWRSYALVHAAMQVAMTSAEVTQATGDAGDENATTEVVAKGILKLNLDRATLQYVFPRVLADEVLVQQLVGKEVVYDTLTTYIFNAAGQVVSQDLAIDFQSGFRKLLGDDALAAKLLGDSLIYDSVKIQVVDGETEGEA